MDSERWRIRGGFSIVELLIVLVVVGVFSSVTTVSVSRARAQVEMALMANELRALAGQFQGGGGVVRSEEGSSGTWKWQGDLGKGCSGDQWAAARWPGERLNLLDEMVDDGWWGGEDLRELSDGRWVWLVDDQGASGGG
ncbi:MAG: prepilin-type N-terminal cleavage/methylation domain-containing protein [Candidatus Synoicihabitans palmerolidicus]|nr:prepilin-type N-terminal cleavage/methylation domain-containing protein [Candidatus Synoicihabitans palmerolidicus]